MLGTNQTPASPTLKVPASWPIRWPAKHLHLRALWPCYWLIRVGPFCKGTLTFFGAQLKAEFLTIVQSLPPTMLKVQSNYFSASCLWDKKIVGVHVLT